MFPVSKSANGLPVELGELLAKAKLALNVQRGLLIFLGGYEVGAERHGMVADNLGHDVAVGVGRVSVFPGEITGVHAKAAAVNGAARCCQQRRRGSYFPSRWRTVEQSQFRPKAD